MFLLMADDANKNNLSIILASAYRSYAYQTYIYSKYKDTRDNKDVDTYSARGGHSEHQTGLAIDIKNANTPYEEFGNTKEFTWMKNNACRFGFILRYPEGKENIHGYKYEPWHYRYVGVNIATDMYYNYPDLTYDEYYYQELNKK